MPDIHPTAIISAEAQLAEDVTVGAYAIIDGPAVIGPGCTIAPRAWITGRVTMGANNNIGHGTVVGSDPQDLSFDPTSDTGVVLGSGNTLREYVTINRATAPGGNTTMGDENFLMTGSHLAHDVRMGSHNVFANNVLLAGHIVVGNRVFIGGGAGMHQFLHIGDLSMIAGNASLSRDIPPFCMTTRRDALAGLNSVGLRRAGIAPEERKELKQVYRLLFLSSSSLSDAVLEAKKSDWSELATQLIDAVGSPSKRGVLGR